MHNRPFGRRTAGRQRESREADAPWPQGWLPERHIATLATFLLTARKLPLEVFKLVLDIGPFAVRRGGNPPAPSRGGRASEVTGCNACKCSSVGHHLSIPLLRTRSTPSWRSPQVSLARPLDHAPRPPERSLVALARYCSRCGAGCATACARPCFRHSTTMRRSQMPASMNHNKSTGLRIEIHDPLNFSYP